MPPEATDHDQRLDEILQRLESIEQRISTLEGSGGRDGHDALAPVDPGAVPGVDAATHPGATPQTELPQGRSHGTRILGSIGLFILLCFLLAGDVINLFLWLAGTGGVMAYAFGAFSSPGREQPKVSASTGGTTTRPAASAGTQELKASVIIGRIGAVIILLGFATLFFIMVEAGVIGPLARLIIALIVAAVALWAGDHFSAKYTSWSRSLTGLGLTLLYFVFFMFTRPGYTFLARELVFVGMVAATALSGYLALRYKSVVVAIFGIVGGYLTPFLLRTGEERPVFLLCYVMLLNLAVLWIASRETWRELNGMSFIASFAYLLTIATQLDPWPAAGAIALIFTFYNLLPVIGSIVRKVKTTGVDILLIALNGVASFIVCLDRFRDALSGTSFGLLASLVAVIYVAQGYAALKRSPSDYVLRASYGLIGIVFLVVAVPLLAGDSHRVTVVIWTLISLLLLWAGFELKEFGLRVLGMILLGISMLGVITTSSIGNLATYTPIWNTRVLVFAIFIAAVYVAGLFYSVGKHLGMDIPRQFTWILPAIANTFTLSLLTLEVSDIFRQQLVGLSAANNFDEYIIRREAVLQSIHVALSVSYTLYAIILIAVGIRFRLRWVRLMALGILGVVVVKVLFVDTSNLNEFARLLLFMVVGVLLMVASYSFQRFKRFIIDEPTPAAPDAPRP